MKISAGVNGFGRFGQHLLRYWMLNNRTSNFEIDYINDPNLTLQESFEVLLKDKYLGEFFKNRICLDMSGFVVKLDKEVIHRIFYTNSKSASIKWLGKPAILFECSGKYTNANKCKKLLIGNTKRILISATSHNADKLLVYGYNHKEFGDDDKIVSYGSCTINAFVILANFINDCYGVLDCSVNVIHNVPEHALKGERTLTRKACSLQLIGPQLLKFISGNNFMVNYTLVPHSGVSIIDFDFRLRSRVNIREIISTLDREIKHGVLKRFYSIDDVDHGSEAYKFSPSSAVIIKENLKLVGDRLFVNAYFDNENSVNRFYDLSQYVIEQGIINRVSRKVL